jgi:hypothetical protein
MRSTDLKADNSQQSKKSATLSAAMCQKKLPMGTQHHIKAQLSKDVTFRVILPLSIPDTIPTRNWLVSGEKTLVFIATSPCLASLEDFSFYCTVSNSEHPSTTEPDVSLRPTAVSLRHPLPVIAPFRLPDNRFMFPVRIQVPHSQLSGFLIFALYLGSSPTMQGSFTRCLLQPFSVVWHRFLTP